MNRAARLRIAACGIIGFGAALMIAALLLGTYTASKVSKIPLDLDMTLVSRGSGTALNPASLAGERFVFDRNKPLVMQQQFTVEVPSNAEVVTLQVGSTLKRGEDEQDSGLLLAMVDTVTLDRETAMAVTSESNPGGSIQKPRTIEDTKPPTNVVLPHEGLSYRFPFATEKKTYPYFDPIAQKAFDANYVGDDNVNGLPTYHFTQNIGYDADGKLVEPVRYPSLYDRDEDSEVTARAAQWGLPGPPEEPITLSRWYAAQKDFWVDPVSGTIVKSKEHAYHYYAREPLSPDKVTFVDYTIESDAATVEEQVAAARDEGDRVALWSRILPITFTATGIVAVVGGVVLGIFSLRTESALIDPGLDAADNAFFARRGPVGDEPVPGAEAETEKLPTQRPRLSDRPPDP